MRNTIPLAYTAVPTGVTKSIGHVRRNQRSRWTGILINQPVDARRQPVRQRIAALVKDPVARHLARSVRDP